MAATAQINNEILRWARDRAEMSADAVAKNITSDVDVFRAWEDGDVRPSLSQAKQLAKRLHIPFGYLYLNEPPQLDPDIPDLRTVGDQPPDPLSVDFVDTLNSVIVKQNWYRDWLLRQGQEPLGLVGQYSVEDGIQIVADSIRDTLNMTPALRRQGGRDQYLTTLVRMAESAGVLVMRSGIVGNNTHRPLSVNEFRGFALIDPYAPVVFVNSRDATAARVFTLLHELAHIWIGESGVSNVDLERIIELPGIEQFCNKVAVEALVPSVEYVDSWANGVELSQNIVRMSAQFKVSGIVVLRRALELGQISRQQFFEQLPNQHYDGPRQRRPGGDPYNTIPARNSSRLTDALLSSMQEGQTLYRDAAQYLGVKVTTAIELARQRRAGR